MFHYSEIGYIKAGESKILAAPAWAKKVTVSFSGRLRFQILTNGEEVMGTGFVNESAQTLLVDPETPLGFVKIESRELGASGDIYVQYLSA